MDQPNSNISNQNNLNIDNVVASQPELGPTPPDGGYGWIILFCSMVLQLTVPSITVAFGMMILFSNLQEEYEENEVFKLWKHNFVVVPILTVIVSVLCTSWSRSVIYVSSRPRIVSISGIFLIAAGILMASIVIEEDDGALINLFAGFLAGIGSSLANQQAEMLLSQYFTSKLIFVKSIYKIYILLGNILVSLLMGGLLSQQGVRTALLVYSGVILQNCIVLIAFTRPTYFVASMQKSYKALKEASEDEDEEIYSSQHEISQPNAQDSNLNETTSTVTIHDDEQDEDVINSFHTRNTVKQVIQPVATLRLENNNRPFYIESQNYFERIDDLEPPESLYRETTIANNNNVQSNIFNFEPVAISAGTARRTSKTKKSVILLFSTLKDIKFYVYTYIDLNVKLSMMFFGLLLPAYISQQVPDMEMWTVAGMVIIIYIGSTCLNIVVIFLPRNAHKKFFLALFSLLSFAGLFALSECSTRPLLMISGMLASFGITALYILLEPIYSDMKVDIEANMVAMSSNFIIATIIMIIILIGNFPYATYFKIAGILQMVSPILLSLIRKTA